MMNLLGRLKNRLFPLPALPVIAKETGSLPVGSNGVTFVMVCGPGFNSEIPNAGTTCRMGWCRGFERIGIPYVILSVFELSRRLQNIPHPICWIAESDYHWLKGDNLRALKNVQHFVWVNTWFEGERDFYLRNGFPINSEAELINQKVLDSDPSFVFTISPATSFEYYGLWMRRGARLVSLPLACDSTLYEIGNQSASAFDDVEMAFVGGYWPYKAHQFDRYLKPYQDKLKVFGYSPWPYVGYAGVIAPEHEPLLYRGATVSPTINEPHVEIMNVDMNERVFKVLGSGGMTVTDVTPGYRAWFSDTELLVPRSLDEYHEMVRTALEDTTFNQTYRKNGKRAVLARHTYMHRAQSVLAHLGIQFPTEIGTSVQAEH